MDELFDKVFEIKKKQLKLWRTIFKKHINVMSSQ